MSGNVSEWTEDAYIYNYYSWGPAVDPVDSAQVTLFTAVVRGGSHAGPVVSARASERYYQLTNYPWHYYGFRLARTSP